jgi:alkylation response protein AidB-like acyl-CoA dehydrogenase
MTYFQARRAFEEFVHTEGRTFPLPGSGDTWHRFEVLSKWAATDLSVGRLVEGHCDAIAILAEAEMLPASEHATYGVWAARSPGITTVAERVPGGWRLTGTKAFCSGSSIIERALVTAETPDGYRIFDVKVSDHVSKLHEDSWPAIGMADSLSHTLDFDGPIIRDDRAVGGAGFYVGRPGFWFGAAGVAACWYGGALALVKSLTNSLPLNRNAHVQADLGIAIAGIEAMRAVLHKTAEAIDADPADAGGSAHFRALVARQVVHDTSMEVLARVGSAGGSRPLCLDEEQSRRAADLFVYLSQHHGGSDAAEIARLAMEEKTCD